jgi:L-threonylcarbamoyladenylate synthase
MSQPDRRNEILDALEELHAGRQIGLPTETVYGLAADATDPSAVEGIFRIKGRPKGHPLILHVAEASWLVRFCRDVPPSAERLAERFWPGPLTLVLFRNENVPDVVTGGLETVAIRVPDHPVALDVLRRFGRPLAAPSANRFGAVSPTTRAHVVRDLGNQIAVVLEGGSCRIGVESTIVDMTRHPPRILRPGAVSKYQIEEALGFELPCDDGQGPAAPGTLEAHYCPRAMVRIVESASIFDEARRLSLLGTRVGLIAPVPLPSDLEIPAVVTGDRSADLAHELYGAFRALDESDCELILVSLPDDDGIGVAVADRIARAAAGSRRSVD